MGYLFAGQKEEVKILRLAECSLFFDGAWSDMRLSKYGYVEIKRLKKDPLASSGMAVISYDHESNIEERGGTKRLEESLLYSLDSINVYGLFDPKFDHLDQSDNYMVAVESLSIILLGIDRSDVDDIVTRCWNSLEKKGSE